MLGSYSMPLYDTSGKTRLAIVSGYCSRVWAKQENLTCQQKISLLPRLGQTRMVGHLRLRPRKRDLHRSAHDISKASGNRGALVSCRFVQVS